MGETETEGNEKREREAERVSRGIRGETFGAAAISYQRRRTVTVTEVKALTRLDALSHPNPECDRREREREDLRSYIYAI